MVHQMTCRICLATEVKLYDIYKYRLQASYECLTGIKINQRNNDFSHVCSFCGTLLIKYNRFRKRCVQSQEMLDQILTHNLVSAESMITACGNSHPYITQSLQKYEIFMHIDVKEETIDNFDIKSDNDSDTAIESVEMNPETIKTDTVVNESDEEPLSKIAKIGKKSKRKKNIKNEIKIENKSDKMDYKLENLLPKDVDLHNDIEVVVLSKEEQIKEVLLRKMSVNYQNAVYKCEICFKGYKTEMTYKNHMEQHSPSAGALVCDVCQIRRPNTRSMNAHSLIAHERRYTCKLCGYTCRTSHKAREHFQWHRGHQFTCHCGRSFDKSTSYLTHVRTYHPTSRRCDVCGECFIGQLGLRLHMKRAHQTENRAENIEHHSCSNCDFKFKNKDALTRHVELMRDGVCDRLRACAQCGDNFTTDEELMGHLKMHQRINSIRTCTECSRTFANERLLSDHRTRVHSRAIAPTATSKRAVCEVCGHTCNTPAALINHQRTHSGEKPYECTVCPKRFSVFQRLQIHLRTHTGERPFQCSICPKAFKQKAALNRHNRIHTGAKPYACPQCGKAFSQSNSMKQHCAGVHMKHYIYSRRPTNKHA